jgi:hypothetical protein
MDTLNAIIQVPSWAYDFCYYYFAVAVIVALYSIYSLVQLFLMPGAYRRVVPFISTVLALALSSLVSIVLALMQFWVCRSALKPTAAPAAKKETFAVACKSGEDCTAVAGTPQGSTCTCGGRGFCGGCTMQNNMEPQAEFAAAFAPFNEGFAGGMAPAQARSRRA